MNNLTDQYIINNIISYLNIHEKIFINKFHYNQSKPIIQSKIHIIENFYIKYKLQLEVLFEYYDDNNLQAIRNYYILFYPKQYRKSIYEQIIKYRTYNLDKKLIITELYEKSLLSNNYNKYFKCLINHLSMSDLAFIGW